MFPTNKKPLPISRTSAIKLIKSPISIAIFMLAFSAHKEEPKWHTTSFNDLEGTVFQFYCLLAWSGQSNNNSIYRCRLDCCLIDLGLFVRIPHYNWYSVGELNSISFTGILFSLDVDVAVYRLIHDVERRYTPYLQRLIKPFFAVFSPNCGIP